MESGLDLTDLDLAAFNGRFWQKIDRKSKDECWPWIAKAKTNYGYGVFAVTPKKRDGAHRLAYMLANDVDAIPDGIVVRHTCDNPACCNPNHLLLGTKRDNAMDMVERGRARFIAHKGQANGRAKLTPSDVEKIRVFKGSAKAISQIFGISTAQAWRVRSGNQWRSL